MKKRWPIILLVCIATFIGGFGLGFWRGEKINTYAIMPFSDASGKLDYGTFWTAVSGLATAVISGVALYQNKKLSKENDASQEKLLAANMALATSANDANAISNRLLQFEGLRYEPIILLHYKGSSGSIGQTGEKRAFNILNVGAVALDLNINVRNTRGQYVFEKTANALINTIDRYDQLLVLEGVTTGGDATLVFEIKYNDASGKEYAKELTHTRTI